MNTLTVEHIADDEFHIRIRDHVVQVDQPADSGGSDTAPTPTELFVGSLVSCIAHYARRYLARHNFDPTGFRVTAEWEFADGRPARVGSVAVHIDVPDSVPHDRRAALLAVASHCTVHNTLINPPRISLDLAAPERIAV